MFSLTSLNRGSCDCLTNPHQTGLKYKIRIRRKQILAGSVTSLQSVCIQRAQPECRVAAVTLTDTDCAPTSHTALPPIFSTNCMTHTFNAKTNLLEAAITQNLLGNITVLNVLKEAIQCRTVDHYKCASTHTQTQPVNSESFSTQTHIYRHMVRQTIAVTRNNVTATYCKTLT